MSTIYILDMRITMQNGKPYFGFDIFKENITKQTETNIMINGHKRVLRNELGVITKLSTNNYQTGVNFRTYLLDEAKIEEYKIEMQKTVKKEIKLMQKQLTLFKKGLMLEPDEVFIDCTN